MSSRAFVRSAAAGAVVSLLLLGCGGRATAPPSPTPLLVSTVPPPSWDPITLAAPATAKAGSEISVGWTGKDKLGDYVVIVPVGTASVSDSTLYVNANVGNPLKIQVPAAPGSYEIWFVLGDTSDKIKARQPLSVQ